MNNHLVILFQHVLDIEPWLFNKVMTWSERLNRMIFFQHENVDSICNMYVFQRIAYQIHFDWRPHTIHAPLNAFSAVTDVVSNCQRLTGVRRSVNSSSEIHSGSLFVYKRANVNIVLRWRECHFSELFLWNSDFIRIIHQWKYFRSIEMDTLDIHGNYTIEIYFHWCLINMWFRWKRTELSCHANERHFGAILNQPLKLFHRFLLGMEKIAKLTSCEDAKKKIVSDLSPIWDISHCSHT